MSVDKVTLIMTDHGERQLYEAPRKDLENALEDVADPQSHCYSPSLWLDILEELKRRDWIWAKYRMGAREN